MWEGTPAKRTLSCVLPLHAAIINQTYDMVKCARCWNLVCFGSSS